MRTLPICCHAGSLSLLCSGRDRCRLCIGVQVAAWHDRYQYSRAMRGLSCGNNPRGRVMRGDQPHPRPMLPGPPPKQDPTRWPGSTPREAPWIRYLRTGQPPRSAPKRRLPIMALHLKDIRAFCSVTPPRTNEQARTNQTNNTENPS